MSKAASQTQQGVNTKPFWPTRILQRKCGCSNQAIAGSKCTSCGGREHGLQREATNTTRSDGSSFQRKLIIGASDDPLEKEADRIADQVMSMSANPAINGAPPRIQRFTGSPTGVITEAPPSVDQVISNPGRPLEPELRQDMESRFGYDFSSIRIHTDEKAAESARAINAFAFTTGHNMVFGANQYTPGSRLGRYLIAHELAHNLQQRDLRTPTIQRQEIEFNFDFEEPDPAQAQEIERLGIVLPEASTAATDPKLHSDYIENRFRSVTWGLFVGLSAGGYLLEVDGIDRLVTLSESQVRLQESRGLIARPVNNVIYASYSNAVANIPQGPPYRIEPYAYYRGAGGSVIAPTLFTPETTPTICRGIRSVLHDVSEEVTGNLTFYLLGLAGTILFRTAGATVAEIRRARSLRSFEAEQSGGAGLATSEAEVGIGSTTVGTGGEGRSRAVSASSVRSSAITDSEGATRAATDPAIARAAVQDTNTIYHRHMRQGGIREVAETGRLTAGPGTSSFGGGDQVRAYFGPATEGAPHPIIEFTTTTPGSSRPYPGGGWGPYWQANSGTSIHPHLEGDTLPITIRRILFPDGSVARPIGTNLFEFIRPSGESSIVSANALPDLS